MTLLSDKEIDSFFKGYEEKSSTPEYTFEDGLLTDDSMDTLFSRYETQEPPLESEFETQERFKEQRTAEVERLTGETLPEQITYPRRSGLLGAVHDQYVSQARGVAGAHELVLGAIGGVDRIVDKYFPEPDSKENFDLKEFTNVTKDWLEGKKERYLPESYETKKAVAEKNPFYIPDRAWATHGIESFFTSALVALPATVTAMVAGPEALTGGAILKIMGFGKFVTSPLFGFAQYDEAYQRYEKEAQKLNAPLLEKGEITEEEYQKLNEKYAEFPAMIEGAAETGGEGFTGVLEMFAPGEQGKCFQPPPKKPQQWLLEVF